MFKWKMSFVPSDYVGIFAVMWQAKNREVITGVRRRIRVRGGQIFRAALLGMAPLMKLTRKWDNLELVRVIDKSSWADGPASLKLKLKPHHLLFPCLHFPPVM